MHTKTIQAPKHMKNKEPLARCKSMNTTST